MPELPEVETIRRQLHARLEGVCIVDVELLHTGRERPKGSAFVEALKGATIRSIDRRAKLLIWRLADKRAVIAHLKMTGRFLFVSSTYEAQKHDAIRIVCQKGRQRINVIWNDVRKFGFMEVLSSHDLDRKLAEYGPEPLETPAKTLADRLCAPTTRLLKAALLDQACIAGVGNIYADEACFRAGVHPKRRLGALVDRERLALARATQDVLQESIDQQGTSAHTYVDTEGLRGGFVTLLRVYGRQGQPCLDCQQPIQKTRLAQRGTHVCPNCQH